MAERDVDGLIAALVEATKTDNEEAGMQAAFGLIAEGLKSLARIADALETIARREQQRS